MRAGLLSGREWSGVSSLRPVSGTAEEILALLREWDAADDPEPLVIATSGSTGRPKRVLLSRDAMRASALATQERLGGPGRWVLNLPPAYVAGVQVLYRSVVAGTEPVPRRLADRAADYVSLVPTQLVRVLRRRRRRPRRAGPVRRRARRRRTARARRARARPRRRGIRVVQTYGMSETCGGCVYDGLPARRRRGADRATARCCCAGRCSSTATTASPSAPRARCDDGWFRTDDLGELGEDGRLRVTGRADDVIISGGVKVPAPAGRRGDLAPTRRCASVEVVGVPDAEWGERVVAFVVGDPPDPRRPARPVEPRPGRRARLVLVDEIPLLPNGKPDRRRALAERCA